MKTFLLFLGMLAFGIAGAQHLPESKVPKKLMAVFKKEHPAAKSIHWEEESPNYIVTFQVYNHKEVVIYTPDGVTLEKKVEIKTKHLPEKLARTIKKKYADETVSAATMITDREGVIKYLCRISGRDHYFDAEGNETGQ